jgi:hypothetical protein
MASLIVAPEAEDDIFEIWKYLAMQKKGMKDRRAVGASSGISDPRDGISRIENAPDWLQKIMRVNRAIFYDQSPGGSPWVHMPNGKRRIVPSRIEDLVKSRLGTSLLLDSDCVLAETPKKAAPRRGGKRFGKSPIR